MDLKQIEYIVTIAEERNITRAAEKLFLTQSGLNQQLLKLERSLGTPLFYRSHGDCRPTEAGEIYLETAREMLRMRREAFNRIHDIVESKKGSLSVGFTPVSYTHLAVPVTEGVVAAVGGSLRSMKKGTC